MQHWSWYLEYLGRLVFGIVGIWDSWFLEPVLLKEKKETKSEISGILKNKKQTKQKMNFLVFGIIVGLIGIIGRLRRITNSLLFVDSEWASSDSLCF